MRAILIIGLFLCAFGGPAEAACTITPWRFIWDTQTDASMSSDGGPCRSSIIQVFRTGEVHSVKIAAGPRHGAASASGRTVNYRPRAGFKGEDSFVFAINGRRNGNPVQARVRVNVTVR